MEGIAPHPSIENEIIATRVPDDKFNGSTSVHFLTPRIHLDSNDHKKGNPRVIQNQMSSYWFIVCRAPQGPLME